MFTAKTQSNTDEPSKRFSITTPSVILSILATWEMLKLHVHPPHFLSYIESAWEKVSAFVKWLGARAREGMVLRELNSE